MASAYIAWYLFFAGAGAGAFAIASVVDFALRLASASSAENLANYGCWNGPWPDYGGRGVRLPAS